MSRERKIATPACSLILVISNLFHLSPPPWPLDNCICIRGTIPHDPRMKPHGPTPNSQNNCSSLLKGHNFKVVDLYGKLGNYTVPPMDPSWLLVWFLVTFPDLQLSLLQKLKPGQAG